MKIDITDIENKGEIDLKPPAEEPVEEEPAAEETTTEEPVEEPQEAGTLHPVITYAKQNPAIICALVVVLVLIVVVIVRMLRKKKPVSEPEAEVTETKTKATEEEVSSVPVMAACVHEIGAREDQQDSYGISEFVDAEKGLLAVVADGMGGLSNGKAVSSLTVKTCMDVFYSLPGYIAHEDMLLQMAVQSNQAVNQMLRSSGKSGSTLVAATIGQGALHFLTIGDSRIYLYRGGALIQLNREHIYREELILSALNGRMSIHQTNHDSQAKSLTSYLGIGDIPHLDRNYEGIKLLSKDKIILSSDGIFGTLSQAQLEAALQLPVAEAAENIKAMVQAAGKQYQDNYTAVVLEYLG